MSPICDVFSVGKEQVWSWCDWCGRTSDGAMGCECECDSLAVGRWLVVMCYARFGFMQTRPTICFAERSLAKALETVKELQEYDECDGLCEGCACDYEIWHVEKDTELWAMWSYLAEQCAQKTEPEGSGSDWEAQRSYWESIKRDNARREVRPLLWLVQPAGARRGVVPFGFTYEYFRPSSDSVIRGFVPNSDVTVSEMIEGLLELEGRGAVVVSTTELADLMVGIGECVRVVR